MYDEETEAFTNDVEVLSGKIADLTKTASKPGGISLFTDENKTTYKSTYQLIKDISVIYDDLTDKQQAGLLEALAGKRQGQVVAATIKNFKAAEKAMNDMANSAGNAEAEMDVIRDSAEYALNELKETFTELSQNAVSRGELKALIKTGTALLDIVNGIVKGVGAIPALLGTIFGIIGTKSKTLLSFNKDTGKFNLFGTELGKGWFSNFKANRAELKATANLVNELRTSFNGVTISEDMMNKVMASSNVELKGLVNDFQNNTIKSGEFATRLDGMSAKLKTANLNAEALKSGLKSLGSAIVNIAASMAISWVITKTIQATTSAIDEAVNSYENNIKKTKELSQSVKSLENDYDSLNDQLREMQKKLVELEKIENPTLLEQGEIEKIKEATKLLENQIKLKELEIELEKKKLMDSAKKTREDAEYGFDFAGYYADLWSSDKSVITKLIDSAMLMQALSAGFKNLGNAAKGNTWKQQTNEIKKYEKALNKANATQRRYESSDRADKNYAKRKADAEKAKAKADEQLAKLKSRYTEWKLQLETFRLDPNTYRQEIKELETAIDAAEKIMGLKKEFNNFYDIYNSTEFSKVRAEMEEIAKAGELTAESFDKLTDDDVSGITAFKEELSKIPNLKVEDVIIAINKAIKDSGNGANDAADEIRDYAKALDELKDKLDDIISKQEKLAEAFGKAFTGGKLSPKEAYELIKEVPEAAKYLEETEDGYALSQEAFTKVNDEIYHQMQTDISKDLLETRNQAALLKKLKNLYDNKKGTIEYLDTLKQYEDNYGAISEDDLSINYDDTLSKLKNAEEAFEVMHTLMNDIFDERQLVTDAINNSYNEAKEKISDCNNQIKTIDDAIKSLKDNSKLTYEEMTSIVDIAPELQDSFTPLSDGTYSISISALEDLRKQSYQTRNDYIDDLIAEARAEIDNAKAVKKANQEKIGYIDEYGNKVEGTISQIEDGIERLLAEGEANELIDVSNIKIDELEKLIEKLEGWRQNLTTDNENDEDSLSDKLQKQIDHYKSIIEAVTIVRDKYAEAIDNEIDALNDSKDALKDANDERQRELDLIEARNDLENAKKRKVYVYSEGEGFKQVQDQKAVKEAEEKYRDAITDIQEAEIDKEIDKREKQKEALDNAIKDLVDAEKNIQNAMVVSQAMKEYGLTDAKDLLTLPDDVKQSIIDGLADSMLQKDIEDNKENEKYNEVTLDSILKELGSTKKASDIDPAVFDNVTQKAYNNAIKEFTDKLKNDAQARIDNVTYNNAPVINANFTINNADDPQAVAETVNKEIGNFLRQYCDSIK